MADQDEAQAALVELDELVTSGDHAGELAAAAAAAAAIGQPVVLELGRYKVFQDPGGGWVVARAVDTCQDCQQCGCGTQADPIAIPALVIQLARSQGGSLRAKIKALRGAGGVSAVTPGEAGDHE